MAETASEENANSEVEAVCENAIAKFESMLAVTSIITAYRKIATRANMWLHNGDPGGKEFFNEGKLIRNELESVITKLNEYDD